MPSPVVVDGRTDSDKLYELLALGVEQAELEFKGTLDLTNRREALNFAKDCIAMMNGATGGYIVVGIGDDGAPAHDLEPVDAARFDAADLAQLVAKFVDVPLNLVRAQHEVDGRTVVLICVQPTPQSLPALIARTGQYEESSKRMKTVLTEGVLYVRSGAQNVAATDGHWPMLLERYRASVVSETRDGLDVLVRKVVEALGQQQPGQSPALSPLLLELDSETFVEAFVQHLDTPSDVQLRQFLRQATAAASFSPEGDGATAHNALDKLASAAVQAMLYRKREVFEMVMDAVHRIYVSGGPVNIYNADLIAPYDVAVARHWLDVLLRVFVVGAAAVRDEQWWAVSSVAKRSVNIEGNDPFASWLRHGLVYASRAHLLSGDGQHGGLVLSMARELAQTDAAFRQDIPEAPVLGLGEAPSRPDPLLDSLCQFDIAWCIVMAALAPKEGQYVFYPSCVALKQQRAQPAINAIALRQDVRAELLPDVSDERLAHALDEVMRLAVQESSRYRSFWDGLDHDPRIESFVRANIK